VAAQAWQGLVQGTFPVSGKESGGLGKPFEYVIFSHVRGHRQLSGFRPLIIQGRRNRNTLFHSSWSFTVNFVATFWFLAGVLKAGGFRPVFRAAIRRESGLQ